MLNKDVSIHQYLFFCVFVYTIIEGIHVTDITGRHNQLTEVSISVIIVGINTDLLPH